MPAVGRPGREDVVVLAGRQSTQVAYHRRAPCRSGPCPPPRDPNRRGSANRPATRSGSTRLHPSRPGGPGCRRAVLALITKICDWPSTLPRQGDAFAVGRPGRRGTAALGQTRRRRAVGVHDVDLGGAGAPRAECDPFPVGRPGDPEIGPGGVGQAADARAVRPKNVDVVVPSVVPIAAGHGAREERAVRAPGDVLDERSRLGSREQEGGGEQPHARDSKTSGHLVD